MTFNTIAEFKHMEYVQEVTYILLSLRDIKRKMIIIRAY